MRWVTALMPCVLAILLAMPARSRVGADLIIFSEVSGKKIALARDLLALNTPAGDGPGHVASPKKSVRYAEADLDGDGIPEVFLAVADAYHCGSAGCTVYVYHRQGEQWRFLTAV